MGDRLVRKGLVLGIIVLFIGSNVVSGLNIQLKNTTNPLFNTRGYIQGLIDNASDGDTIYIPNGTYFENIIINKSISLAGEDKNTTIIDGGGSGDVVTINVDEVTVSDFTIQNSGNDSWNDAGVQINSNMSNIIGNFIVNCSQGVYITPEDEWYETYTYSNIVAENSIKNNRRGLTIIESKYTKIYDNNIINNGGGIHVMPLYFPIKNDYQCQVFRYYNNKIYRNNVTNNNDGIHLFVTSYDEVYENQITENKNGIILEGWYSFGRCNNIYQNNVSMNNRGVYISSWNGGSNSNNIYQNNITNNNEGIFILSVGGFLCDGANNNNVFQNNIMANVRGIYINCQFLTNGARNNNIYYNNFIGNTEDAYDNSINIWDNGSVGNYWDDYKGKDNDKDGIGDTPYNIRPYWKGNKDNYPLMKPVNNVTKILSIQQNSQSSLQSFSIPSSQDIMSVVSSTGNDLVKLSTKATLDGNILYVGGTGEGNYTRIQDAINDAVDGDTILVYSGNYNEYIRIDKQLFMKGIKKPGEDYPTINGGNDYDTVIIYVDGCSFEDFIVRNGPGGFTKKAITLQSNNNIVMNCTTFNTGWGIYLPSSSDNVIAKNKIYYGGGYGFYLVSSCNNTFFDNNIYDHDNLGVLFSANSNNNWFYNNSVHDCSHSPAFKIVGSVDNLISGNNISNNYKGLIIESCRNTTVIENIFINDGIIISGTIDEMTSNIFENNLVNGRPYYFYGNKNGITIPEDAGQIFLVNCSNCIIKNFNITRVDYGIQLIYSSNNTIINNDIRGTDPAGITLSQSHDNLISRNYINGCREGILLDSSDRNIISNNTVADHPYHVGIGVFYGSDNNEIINNTVINSRFCIDVLFGSYYNKIINNNVLNCTYHSIDIYATSNNLILNNYINNSENIGIYIQDASANTIKNNNITGCVTAIECWGTESNDFFKNIISKNKQGIVISTSENNYIFKNNITNNLDAGVYLSNCINTIIEKNNLIGNNPNANFVNEFPNLFNNKWIKNYWDLPFLKPKVITGSLKIVYYTDPYTGEEKYKTIPWSNYDWSPVKEPYNITTTKGCDIE